MHRPTPLTLPSYQHVFVVVLENHGYTNVIGNANAPRINQLARMYGLATNYYGVTHPSEPNYVALIGGSYFGIQDDAPYSTTVRGVSHTIDASNLADQLHAAKLTWKSYQQSLPYPGYTGAYYPSASNSLYVSKHDPFLNFADIQSNPTRLQHLVPDTQLLTGICQNSEHTLLLASDSLQTSSQDLLNLEGGLTLLATPMLVCRTVFRVLTDPWRGVQPAVAARTRACSYDRAGLGWSDPGPLPRTSRREIRELHRLLANAGETGPYVLVGHSFGGWNALLYARQYRRDITGLVLIDAAPLDEDGRFPLAERAQEAAQRADAQRCLAGETPLAAAERAVGLNRLGEALNPAPAPPLLDEYPPAIRSQVRFVTNRWLENGAPLCGAGAAEIVALGESATEGHARGALGTMPLVVITRGLPETWAPPIPVHQTEQAWQAMQRGLVALSATGRQVIARRSRHHIQFTQPGIVVAAILHVVEDVRHGEKRHAREQG